MPETSGQPSDWVDLERYPLLDPNSSRMGQVLAEARRGLAEIGAAEIPGFLHAQGLSALRRDAETLASLAYRSEGYGTAYLGPGADDLPEDHPRRWLGRYAVGVVAYDQFPPHSPIRRLYEWQPLMDFIEAILGRGRLYRYADPLGALNLAVMNDGDLLQWHYDQTDFVVSLALQDAEKGGDFDVAPLIRNTQDENYGEVGRVLAGQSERVVTLPMTPGTLLVFEGRNSIHQVSEIKGSTARLVGLLAYDTKPGTCSTDLLRLARYGRTG